MDYEFTMVSTEKRACEANPAGEDRTVIYTVCVKCVSFHHVKLAYLVLHMAVNEVFGSLFYK